MEILGERPVWSMSGSEQLSTLDAVIAERARLKVVELQLTAELERNGHAQEVGAADTARLLSKRYRMDLPKARRAVRLATALAKHPATSAALPDPTIPFPDPSTARGESPDANERTDAGDDVRDGSSQDDRDGSADAVGSGDTVDSGGWRVHPDQAEAIMAVLAKVPSTVPIENVDFAEQRLIELAATHTPSQLRDAGKPILAILDPDGPEPHEKQAYARESLTWRNVEQGVKFNGYLACENAELFRTVIHTGAKPRKTVDGEPDPRPHSKRQADALTTALTNALAATGATRTANGSDRIDPATVPAGQDPLPDLPDEARSTANSPDRAESDAVVAGHGPKTHISLTIDFNDLKAATTNAFGTMMFGDTLSAATIRRLACDAEVLPIVLGSKSQPLDVGTTHRLITRHMRRVLNVRDKGCVVCGAPPIHCEGHHLEHWIDGGATAVSNLVLLCKRDHIDLHSGHWRIQIVDDVVHVTRPTWADPAPTPRGKYRPPQKPPPPITPHQAVSTTGTDARPPTPATPDFNPWDDCEPTSSTPETSRPTLANLPKLNPWGDDPDTTSPRTPTPPPTADLPNLNPWGDCLDPSTNTPVRPTLANPNPWGDEPDTTTSTVGTARRPPSNLPRFDPWGDDPAIAADRPGLTDETAACPPITSAFDPWADEPAAENDTQDSTSAPAAVRAASLTEHPETNTAA